MSNSKYKEDTESEFNSAKSILLAQIEKCKNEVKYKI